DRRIETTVGGAGERARARERAQHGRADRCPLAGTRVKTFELTVGTETAPTLFEAVELFERPSRESGRRVAEYQMRVAAHRVGAGFAAGTVARTALGRAGAVVVVLAGGRAPATVLVVAARAVVVVARASDVDVVVSGGGGAVATAGGCGAATAGACAPRAAMM